MFFTVSFYIALGIFALGLLYKVSTWFRYDFGQGAEEIRPSARVLAAFRGIILILVNRRILTSLRVFVFEILFQARSFRQSFVRWLMHMCIFAGFVLLLLMHALDKLITSAVFVDYSPTLNPFLFLRNFFAALVLIGLGIAIYRRFIQKIPRLHTSSMDSFVIVILAIMVGSGIFLEGVKITSYNKYTSMVDEYASFENEEGPKSLESYWVKEFDIVSPKVKGPFDPNVLAQGKEIHEMNCAGCHSKPQWAFISDGVAKAIKPAAIKLDRVKLSKWLLYVHFLASFIGLAYLPFSKLFHIFASPLSLLLNALMDPKRSDPANLLTKQIIELDACTHCGACTIRCAVGVWVEKITNVRVLPSEKISPIRALASGKKLDDDKITSLLEGLYLCTNCYRCTVACPVGINLQELWFNVREALFRRGYTELAMLSPLSFYRALRREDMAKDQYQQPQKLARSAIAEECQLATEQHGSIDFRDVDQTFTKNLKLSEQANSMSYCFACTTCTSACPVVRNFTNPPQALGMVPHQIIHAAMLGLGDLIFPSEMLWACLGCYQCQEACPQGVLVTDVFYELKNMAMERLKRNGRRS